jgi:hypothetical protein
MSLAISQTSAAKIVRCSRPTESDIDHLVRDFNLHPLDAEGLLRVPEHSAADKFRDYAMLTWCLPWPGADGLVAIDLRFIVGQKMLVLIGETPDKTVSEAVAEATTTPMMNEGGASTIFAQVIQRVAAKVTDQDALASTNPAAAAELLRHAADMLHSFLDNLATVNITVTEDDRRLAALAVHRLKHAAEKVAAQPPTVPVFKPANRELKVAAGYTVVSVILLLAVLTWR